MASWIYEDDEFPATIESVYFRPQKYKTIKWMRPKEICRVKPPEFIVNEATRFDLNQGFLGNCWFIAAAAVLATRRDLFDIVVPSGQGFGQGYTGGFYFKFWRYGGWETVCINDQLPTRGGHLIFCKNRWEPEEMWSPLLEKAYAKVHGSYEALIGGWPEDALVDLTGGIGRRFSLQPPAKSHCDLWKMLYHDTKMNSLLCATISSNADSCEEKQVNGLVKGHAYSITKVSEMDIHGRLEQLVRLRNPWGKKEWNGAWSDNSPEWTSVDERNRKRLGLVIIDDGEFWMSFHDFLKCFKQMHICHLPPGNVIRGKQEWIQVAQFASSWVKYSNAGGRGNDPFIEEYWTNPQYAITLTTPDDGGYECTLIVSLMQKYARAKRTEMKTDDANIYMSFDLYEVKRHATVRGGGKYAKTDLKLSRSTRENYVNYREITKEYLLPPGTYVVIPSTFYPNTECHFLLRFFTEKDADSMELSTT